MRDKCNCELCVAVNDTYFIMCDSNELTDDDENVDEELQTMKETVFGI